MTEYSFQEGIPAGFTPDFEAGIFHDTEHLLLQSPTGWHSFTLLNKTQHTIVAEVHFHADSGVAFSPLRSPYGSFVFAENISPELLHEFVTYAEHQLKKMGVHTILLKNSPEVYSRKSQMLNEVLLETGYRVHLEETSAVLVVDNGSYSKNLNQSKKGLLKKSHDNQLRFQQFSLSRLREVYDFLVKCYTEKGYSISMTWEEVKKVVDVFPEDFLLHTIFHHDQLVAASISIRVKPTVLYTFYYNHLKVYDFVSPIVFLCEGLYQFCQQANIQLLDLGTSNKGAELNEPLFNFKLSLGAKPSRKLTFAKNLS